MNPQAPRLIRILLGSACLLFLAERPLPDRREAVRPWLPPAAGEGEDFQRWWWAFEQRAYPLGYIPEEALPRDMEEMRRADAWALSAPSRGSAGGRWAGIGPAPMTGGQIGTGGVGRPMSGRVNVVAADPSDANHWLIGADTGGIWETRDAGAPGPPGPTRRLRSRWARSPSLRAIREPCTPSREPSSSRASPTPEEGS